MPYSAVAIISLVGPAVVITAVNLGAALFGTSTESQLAKHITRRQRIAAKAWETHAGCLGLCTGLAVTLFITAGLKNMVGKPRPDLLARCDPDLSNIARYAVGGIRANAGSGLPPFVTSAICQQPNKRVLDDGFASFPSGHASFNSAGMVYLTLWLCSRWRIGIPFLHYPSQKRSSMVKAQASIAAPPLWQVALAFAPIFVVLFICSSRYADFHHGGFDIIAGAVPGTMCGWTSFRLYHMPLRRSRGLVAWGPRSESNAFVVRAKDNDDNVDDEEQGGGSNDIELGRPENGPPTLIATGKSNDTFPNSPRGESQRREKLSLDQR